MTRTSSPKPEYWTCVCGKKHLIEPGKVISCYDAGHQVEIRPAYWTYQLGKTAEPEKGQLSLL